MQCRVAGIAAAIAAILPACEQAPEAAEAIEGRYVAASVLGDACSDIESNVRHCGGCDVRCEGGERCIAGMCMRETAGEGRLVSRDRESDRGGTRDAGAETTAALTTAGWIELAGQLPAGPTYAGRLSAIVVKESNPDWMMVASPGGGIWRRTIAGGTWTRPASYGASGLGDLSVVHLEWDLATPTMLWAMTWNGVYSSVNDGTSWTQRLGTGGSPVLPSPPRGTGGVADPRPFAQMWSGGTRVIFAARVCQGVSWSTNGTTFNTRNPWSTSGPYDNCVGAVAADSTSGWVYVAAATGFVGEAPRVRRCLWANLGDCPTSAWYAVTQDGGPTGMTPGRAVSAMTAASTSPSNPRIVAELPPVDSGASGQIFATTTIGSAWTYQGQIAGRQDVRPLVWRGGTTNEVLMGSIAAWWTGNLGMSWTSFTPSLQHIDTRGMYVNGGRSTIWAVTDGDTFDSRYAIVTAGWSTGLPPSTATQVPDLGINSLQQFFVAPIKRGSSVSSRWLLTGGMDNGGGCSTDGGGSWSYYSPQYTPGSTGWDHLAVLQACVPMGMGCNPSTSRAYFFNNGQLFQSTNLWAASSCAGVLWTPRSVPGVAEPWSSHSIALRPGSPESVYVARSNPTGFVQVSTNGGGMFTPTAPVLDNGRPTSIYVTGTGAIIVGTGRSGDGSGTLYPPRGIYRMEPGGAWVQWGLNTNSPEYINAITATGTGSSVDTFWAATTSGVWRRVLPFGSWTLVLSSNPAYGASDVAIDPQNANRVYVGQGFVNQMQEHRGGVVFTDDGGASWCSLSSGWLPHATPISDVEVDPYDSSRIWVATFGAGVWAYDGAGSPPSCP